MYVADTEEVKKIAALLFAVQKLPFGLWESELFQKLIELLNPDLAMLLPKTADSIRRMIKVLFTKQKSEVRELIVTSRHKICLAFDLWTSPNHLGMLGVVANWSDGRTIKRALLAMPNVEGRHTGQNLAKAIRKIETDFSFAPDRVVAHVVDYASNNGTTIEALGDENRTTQVFCVGHGYNLSARTLLNRLDNVPTTESDDGNQDDYGDDEEDENNIDHDREEDNNNNDGDDCKGNDGKTVMGPVTKIRELANHLSRSPHLQQLWKAKFGKGIPNDNTTRWNSVFTMIKSVTSQFKGPNTINEFLETADVDIKMKNKLIALRMEREEWNLLHDIEELLAPFECWTKKLEGGTSLLHYLTGRKRGKTNAIGGFDDVVGYGKCHPRIEKSHGKG